MDLFNKVRNAILEGVDRKKQNIQREIADLQNKITRAHMGGHGDVKVYQAEINRLRAQLREEPEQIDELSTKTLDSYRNKARSQIITARNKDTDTTEKRLKGYTKASRAIGKNFVKGVDEEAEQIAELSDATLKSYAKKAMDQATSAYGYQKDAEKSGDRDRARREMKHKWKRQTGARNAIDRLGNNTLAKEEVEETEEAVKNPYAVGMAAAMKSTGDKPPLKKSTIIKGHEIAKGIEAKEDVDKGLEDELMSQRQGESGKRWRVQRAGKTIGAYDSKDKADVKAMKHPLNKVVSAKEEVEIIEGVEVSTSTYEFSHGKKPKGSGGWMFSPHKNPDMKTQKDDVFSTHGSYADAKKKAAAWAKGKGHSTIHALPEEVELEEGRGRPPKIGSEAWKRAQTERKKDPAEHIINRMGQAATNMTGGQHITYDDGKVHRVGNNLAARTLAHYRSLKPAEKETFQKKIAKSHQDHLDALGGK